MARETAEQADYEWDLEALALLSPLQDDPEAMERILKGISYGSSVRYMVQRITDERAVQARKAHLAASLEASGVTILDQVPASAVALRLLLAGGGPGPDHESEDPGRDHDGDITDDEQDGDGEEIPELDLEEHGSCPGAAAFFPVYQATRSTTAWTPTRMVMPADTPPWPVGCRPRRCRAARCLARTAQARTTTRGGTGCSSSKATGHGQQLAPSARNG